MSNVRVELQTPMKPVVYAIEKDRPPRPVYTPFLADLMREAGMQLVEA